MNSNSILQSNLLDIIFENRNKDYGAYVLRRDYNKRLLYGLLAMFGLVLMLSALQLFKSNKPYINTSLIVFNPDTLIFSRVERPRVPPPVQIHAATSPRTPSEVPVIAPDIVVDHLPTAVKDLSSVPGVTTIGPPSDLPAIGQLGEGSAEKSNVPEKPQPVTVSHEPTTSPEVMPQYPGGINEFIKFMKHNLKSPRDLDENEDVTVKVKFIVSFDGSLQGFNIVETGSKDFDDEVVRVLKKMPKWIPGKTNGENVSVYFTLPVKFTSLQ